MSSSGWARTLDPIAPTNVFNDSSNDTIITSSYTIIFTVTNTDKTMGKFILFTCLICYTQWDTFHSDKWCSDNVTISLYHYVT